MNMKILSIALIVSITLVISPAPAGALEKIRLQLKWHHQFQFAGYYAAREMGYYSDAGLDVELIPCNPDENPVQKVLQGEAEFGISSTDLLLLREQGEPVVALAVIFQHSPLALVSIKDKDIQSIHDLAGRKAMIEPGASELFAYVQKEGISPEKYTLLPHSFHVNDLLAGKAQMMSAYVTDEPFELRKAGYEYMLYSPRSVGIDFYGDTLFTTKEQLRLRPETVRAFRSASLKGWEYAIKHPEELVQLIYSRYSKRHSIEHLRFEADQMKPLLQTPLVELGHMNPGRWRHIADTYAELGMLKANFDFKDFLYDPNPRQSLKWFYAGLAGAFGLALVCGLIAIRFFRLSAALKISNLELNRMQKSLEESNRKLEVMSTTDGLTGIANRRHFDEVLSREYARHVRTGAELSLIMLDIDHFKAFNDNYGHLAGDECLRQISRVIAECTNRPADLAARFGGEEFACILPETGIHGALLIAEKIRLNILALEIPHKGSSVEQFVTSSLGVVTVLCSFGIAPTLIINQVDNLLYKAKSSGRNRVESNLTVTLSDKI